MGEEPFFKKVPSRPFMAPPSKTFYDDVLYSLNKVFAATKTCKKYIFVAPRFLYKNIFSAMKVF